MESAMQQTGERRTKRLRVLAAGVIFWATLLVALGISLLKVLAFVLFAGAIAGSIVAVRQVSRTSVRDALRTIESRLEPSTRSLAAWSGRHLQAFRDALNTHRTAAASDRRLQEAWRLSRVGTSLRNAGLADEAVEQCGSAAWAFRELGDRRGEALALNSLGLAHARRGDPERAISAYEEAIGLLGELGEQHAQGQVMANLAVALLGQDQQEEAQRVWRTAFAHLEPGSPEHLRMSQQRPVAS
jgi:tetratricopeptide (TPR) repeat protein